MGNVKKKVSEVIDVGKKYWNEPSKGNYVPYKEVASLGIAGLGVNWTSTLASTIGLSAGNFLIGSCIGLRPIDLQLMLIVANIIGIPIGIFRGWYFDNHNMKGGKFLPFMKKTAFPIFLISTVFVWLPFDDLGYIAKAVAVEIFYVVLQIFLCFYNEGFAYLQQIISPNAQERATVMSISQIIYSFAPTVTNFVIPTIAGLTYGIDNIWTYRVIYPVFTVVGLIVNYIFFRKVKERLILPKKKIEYISMIDAIREVSKNKYFWIINGAEWVAFTEGAYGVILGWSFVYAYNGAKDEQLGLANTIIGNAALWSMLLAPIAIKKFGKRNLLIACNAANIVIFICMYPTFKSLVMVCVLCYINNFVNTFRNIYLPAINADMRDYHQWKTGVRVDGLFAPLNTIGTVLGFFTGLVIPAIYEKMGLHENYEVLYNDTLRNNLFSILIICSIIGAALNLIPYLFYDLTEAKHQGYVNVIKIRTMFEDYGNGDLDNAELVEAMEIINSAKSLVGKEKTKVDKTELKQARKMPKKTKEQKEERKAKIKEAKRRIDEIKAQNDMIEIMPIVLEELDKFSTKRYQIKLENAQKIYDCGKLCYYENLNMDMKAAKALPHNTKEEKEIRSDAINLVRSKRASNKLIERFGIDNISYLDESVKNEIENREIKSISENIKARQDLKAYVKNNSVYNRATAPYNQAMQLIVQAENYNNLCKIEELYSQITDKESVLV